MIVQCFAQLKSWVLSKASTIEMYFFVKGVHVQPNDCIYTVDSEIFMRILFSRIALKDILVM